MDSHGTPRTRLVRSFLRALGISCRLHWTPAPRCPHLHRTSRRNCPHAPRPLSPLHLPRVMALVPRPGLPRHEVRRELARSRQILPQVRRRDRRDAPGGRRVLCLEPLAEPAQLSAIDYWPSVNPAVTGVLPLNAVARLRIVQFGCILMVLACIWVSRLGHREWQGSLAPRHWIVMVAAIWSAISGFTLQRRIVNRPVNSRRPSKSTPFTRWRAGHIFRLWTAMC